MNKGKIATLVLGVALATGGLMASDAAKAKCGTGKCGSKTVEKKAMAKCGTKKVAKKAMAKCGSKKAEKPAAAKCGTGKCGSGK